MPNNYRLPLKNFEHKRWENSYKYKKNVKKMSFIPIFGICLVLTLVIVMIAMASNTTNGVNNLVNKQVEGARSVTILQGENDETLIIDGCSYKLNNNLANREIIWQTNSDCDRKKDGYFLIKANEPDSNDSIQVNKNPDLWLSSNLKNISINNTNLLTNPYFKNEKDYLAISSVHSKITIEGLEYGLVGECKGNTKCSLVSKKNGVYSLIVNDFMPNSRNKNGFQNLSLDTPSTGKKDVIVVVTNNNNGENKKWLLDITAKTLTEID